MSSIAAIVAFVFVMYHAFMMLRAMSNNDTQSRVDLSRVTHYDYVNASFNRHGRAIVRTTSQRVI